MKLLIHCIHYPVCSGRYVVDAFRRLGHEVYHVGEYTGRQIWGMEVPSEYAWQPEPPPDDWQPDLAILMDTAYQWHHESAPTVVWSVDNHVRDLRQDGVSHYFLAHKSVSVMEWGYEVGDEISADVYEHEDMTWLPCAYDPVAFPPSPIPFADREYDVCCIGFMYPKRWELVNAMRAAGLKVLAGTGLVYDAYRDAHHNSRVALVSSFNGDLPIRLFEAMGMGCVVLSNPIEDLKHLDNGANPVLIYNDTEQAVRMAIELQSDPAAEAIAEVNTVAAAQHTWDKRAQVIIDWLEARS